MAEDESLCLVGLFWITLNLFVVVVVVVGVVVGRFRYGAINTATTS